MNKAEGLQKGDQRSVSPGRHKRNCTVCAHDKCEEIEREFVNWTGASAIARDYGLADKATVYRHAHAFGLFVKRQRNIRAALEKIIERAGDVEVTSSFRPTRRLTLKANGSTAASTSTSTSSSSE